PNNAARTTAASAMESMLNLHRGRSGDKAEEEGSLDIRHFRAWAVVAPRYASVVECLEDTLGRNGERHAFALRSFFAQLHRVHHLRIHLSPQSDQTDAREKDIGSRGSHQNAAARLLCCDQHPADSCNGCVLIPVYESGVGTLVHANARECF